MRRIWCWLFGCYIDMGDGSDPFECFRCAAVPDDSDSDPSWRYGVQPFRFIYRKFNGW